LVVVEVLLFCPAMELAETVKAEVGRPSQRLSTLPKTKDCEELIVTCTAPAVLAYGPDVGVATLTVRRVADGEAFENREQQHAPLQGRHLRQRLLEAPAHAAALGRLVEAAERLLQTMKQGEHAKLRVLHLRDKVGLLHGNLGTQADPLVAALLRSRYGARIAPQERKRPGDGLGHVFRLCRPV
jgi:hypothetical protein